MGKDPEQRREEHRRLERLDYAVDSAGHVTDHEDEQAVPTEHDGRGEHRTGFRASDADGDTKKWQRLAAANEHGYHDERKTRRDWAGRKRDIEILVQTCNDYATEQELNHVLDAERVISLLEDLKEERDGLNYGQVPVEVLVLAALTLHANREGWMIRQTDLFEEFMERYVPADSDVDRGEVMRARQTFRDHLDTF